MPTPAPLAAILADPAAQIRWIRWRVLLHAKQQRNAAAATFRTTRKEA